MRILRSGQRRGITRTLRAMIKRRSAIEPTIGHMKTDGRLGRNPLKGALGDALHAVLCGAGHNIRLLLKKLRLLWLSVLLALTESIRPQTFLQKLPVSVSEVIQDGLSTGSAKADIRNILMVRAGNR